MQKWFKVENVSEFLRAEGRKSAGTHTFKPLKRIPWPVCTRCGLLALRNEATRRAVKAPCITYED